MNVSFIPDAFEHYINWQATDKQTFKRINALIHDIQRNGFSHGIGKPELLKGAGAKLFSRRINLEHSLIYSEDEYHNLLIVSCNGHYENL